jgi:hypothetical protein
MSTVSLPYAVYYQIVPINSMSAVALGPTGGQKGDIITRLVVTVNALVGSSVILIDDAKSYTIVAENTPIGVYVINMDAASLKGAWSMKTGLGVSVMAIGQFT